MKVGAGWSHKLNHLVAACNEVAVNDGSSLSKGTSECEVLDEDKGTTLHGGMFLAVLPKCNNKPQVALAALPPLMKLCISWWVTRIMAQATGTTMDRLTHKGMEWAKADKPPENVSWHTRDRAWKASWSGPSRPDPLQSSRHLSVRKSTEGTEEETIVSRQLKQPRDMKDVHFSHTETLGVSPFFGSGKFDFNSGHWKNHHHAQ